MTPDLKYLAFTAMLTAALWIPYIVCQVMTNGGLKPQNYRDPTPRPVPLWGQRAHRAYLNSIETLAPFAALVIIAQIAGKADAMTAMWAMIFFCARIVHAVVFWAAIPYIRTLAFVVGFVAVVGIFCEII
ncbi:MAG: MAPEG family protein [Stellaceae bacterium]